MRRAFRERRRVALLVVFVYAALRLAGPAWAAEPLAAAALAAGLGAALGALGVFAPGCRGLTETVAVACLAFAALVRALGASALDPGVAAFNPVVALGVWLGLAALAGGLRRALATLPLPRLWRPRFKARAGSRIDIYRLWSALAPASCPQAPSREQSDGPAIAAVEDVTLRPGPVRSHTRVAPEPAEPPNGAEGQVLEVDAPFRIRLRTGTCDGFMDAAGVSEIFLVELGPQRLVLLAHEFAEMPLGRALLAWLDDLPGRMLDRRLAAIERGGRTRDARRPPNGGRTAANQAIEDWEAGAVRDAAPDDGFEPRAPTMERRAS